MSYHERAVADLATLISETVRIEVENVHGVRHDPTANFRATAKVAIEHFLAALSADGPVVVIDGKVAGLDAVFAEFLFSNLVAVTSADEIEEAIGFFLAAAREVAE